MQTEITQLMRQLMDVSQERDDAIAARDAASLELRSSFVTSSKTKMQNL